LLLRAARTQRCAGKPEDFICTTLRAGFTNNLIEQKEMIRTLFLKVAGFESTPAGWFSSYR
jgi:hypothetical protein